VKPFGVAPLGFAQGRAFFANTGFLGAVGHILRVVKAAAGKMEAYLLQREFWINFFRNVCM